MGKSRRAKSYPERGREVGHEAMVVWTGSPQGCDSGPVSSSAGWRWGGDGERVEGRGVKETWAGELGDLRQCHSNCGPQAAASVSPGHWLEK